MMWIDRYITRVRGEIVNSRTHYKCLFLGRLGYSLSQTLNLEILCHIEKPVITQVIDGGFWPWPPEFVL